MSGFLACASNIFHGLRPSLSEMGNPLPPINRFFVGDIPIFLQQFRLAENRTRNRIRQTA